MNALTLSISRQRRKTIHWVLQTIGFVITFLGILFEFLRREKYSSAHFNTTHAITGLIAFIFSIVALINGVMASKAWYLRQYIRPIYSKFFHNLIGIASFVIGKRHSKYLFCARKMTNNFTNYFSLIRYGVVVLWLRSW